MSSSQLEKQTPDPKPKTLLGRLKSKRAIALLTTLVVVAVVLAVLGATNVLTPHKHNTLSTQPSPVTDGGNGASSGGGAVTNNGDGSNSGDNKNGDGSNNNDGSNNDNGSNNNDGSNNDNGSNSNGAPSNSGSGSGPHGTTGNSGGSSNSTGNVPPVNPGPWRPQNSSNIADGTPLRIMCMGASIVLGERSLDYNGFRDTVHADLSGLGAPINMAGSQRRGDMIDNDHEGYGGNRVSQTLEHAKLIVPKMRPNVFIINVGTNNVLQFRDTDVAGKHMEALVDYLLETSPRSTVVMSTLLTNKVPNREPLILDINQQFRDVFKKYKNKPVVLAELHPSSGLPNRPQPEDIGWDGSHPNDGGYEKMGHILAEAVKEADSKGYLRWPEDGLAYDGEKSRAPPAAA